MRYCLSRLLAGAAAAGLLAGIGWSGAASAQTVRKLTYATYIPDTFAMTKADIWFMDEVTKRTNGRITFEKYYSGSLLKASDILPGVASGAADIGNSVPSAYNRQDYPLSNITLPFVTTRVDSMTRAFKDLYDSNPQFRKEYESRGLKLLYAPAYGENTIWSTKEIAKPADVKGLRVRAVLAIGDALLATDETFDEVIVSTLPLGRSRWLKQDVIHRLNRAYPRLKVTHVMAAPASADADSRG